MEYNIKIQDVGEGFWEKLNSKGFKFHRQTDGIIYKYVSFETAKIILKNSSLLYSNPNTFNDPFDLTVDLINTEISKEEMIQLINEEFIANADEKNRIIEYNINNPDFLASTFKNTLHETKSQIGITCFSKSYMKSLMWSHYADKHSGLCLGFSFKEINRNYLLQLAIKYSTHIEQIYYIKDTVFSIYNWLFTKSDIWNYEEEVRRVYLDRNGVIPFEKDELVEIYYGLSLPNENITEIQNMLTDYSITKQSKMKMNPNTFNLIEEELINKKTTNG